MTVIRQFKRLLSRFRGHNQSFGFSVFLRAADRAMALFRQRRRVDAILMAFLCKWSCYFWAARR
jgi:hypothetical protein